MATATAPKAEPMKINWVKVGGAIASVIVFFVIRYANIEGLSEMGKGTLALLGACVVLWITAPISMTLTSVLGMILAVVLKYSTMATALSGFGTTFLLLYAAMGMGAAINMSGLGKRIALLILTAVGKPTFKRVILAVFLVVFAFEFLIPSVLAKSVAILAVMLPVVALFGQKLDSKISMAINLSVILGAYAGTIVLPTGGINPVLVYGVMQQLNIPVNFAEWAVLGTPLAIVIMTAFYFFIIRWIKPEVDEVQGGRETIQKELKALPPMGIKEIWCAVIVAGIIILWLLDSTLGIGAHNVGMIGICLLCMPIVGAFSFADMNAKFIPWDLMMLVAGILGISNMPAAAGAGPVIAQMVEPVTNLATSPIGMALAGIILNIVQYTFMLAIPIIPFVIQPLAEIGATWGASPNVAAIYYLVFYPYFIFWGFLPFYQIANKDGATTMKDWIIASVVLFAIAVVATIIWSFTWVPVVINMHLAG